MDDEGDEVATDRHVLAALQIKIHFNEFHKLRSQMRNADWQNLNILKDDFELPCTP